MENPKDKIIIKPFDVGPILEFSGAMKDLIRAGKALSDASLKDEEVFLEKVKAQINSLNNSNKTNIEKLTELTTFKHELEKLKAQTNIGQEKKLAEKAITTIINPEVAHLNELMRIEKEFGPVQKKTENINPNESVINPTSIQINADLQPNFVYVKIEPARLTSVQIIEYFTKLTKINNPINNAPFMSEKDLGILMARIIPGLNGDVKNGHFIALNLDRSQKGFLIDFIYALYQKNESTYKGTKQKYVDLLIQNFDIFKEDNSLYKNMVSRTTKSANPLLPK